MNLKEAYDAISLADLLGLVLGVAGFGVTLWQIHKTKLAAEGAREAATEAVGKIRRIQAATKMHDICQRSRVLIALLRAQGSLHVPAQAALELCEAMAKYRHDDESRSVVIQEIWDRAISDAKGIHHRIELSAQVERITDKDKTALVVEVAALHTQFTSLAAKAAVSENTNANPN